MMLTTSKAVCASAMSAQMRIGLMLVSILLVCPGLLGQDPTALPHDDHDGLLIAADSYLDAARAKEKFGKSNDPYAAGILPVDVFFKNSTDQALRINLTTIRLEIEEPGQDRQRLESLPARQVALLIAHPAGSRTPEVRRIPTPIPIPKGDSKTNKIADSLRPLAFDSDVLPPHATVHGFLFFDVSNDFSVVKYATLYVPDVSQIPSNKLLMYFELPLIQNGSN